MHVYPHGPTLYTSTPTALYHSGVRACAISRGAVAANWSYSKRDTRRVGSIFRFETDVGSSLWRLVPPSRSEPETAYLFTDGQTQRSDRRPYLWPATAAALRYHPEDTGQVSRWSDIQGQSVLVIRVVAPVLTYVLVGSCAVKECYRFLLLLFTTMLYNIL